MNNILTRKPPIRNYEMEICFPINQIMLMHVEFMSTQNRQCYKCEIIMTNEANEEPIKHFTLINF